MVYLSDGMSTVLLGRAEHGSWEATAHNAVPRATTAAGASVIGWKGTGVLTTLLSRVAEKLHDRDMVNLTNPMMMKGRCARAIRFQPTGAYSRPAGRDEYQGPIAESRSMRPTYRKDGDRGS